MAEAKKQCERIITEASDDIRESPLSSELEPLKLIMPQPTRKPNVLVY